MASIGTWNSLTILRHSPHGPILDGGELGDILLPKKFLNDEEVGEEIGVFIHCDSEDRLVATTQVPLLTRNEFAYLTCVSVNRIGAFVDIGLEKDVLIPYAEQHTQLSTGKSYIIFLYVDKVSSRLVGSTKTNKWLQKGEFRFLENQEVEILITEETEIGWKAIINHMDLGMLYKSQVFQPLAIGQKLQAYVVLTREDGKIDLTLQAPAEELSKQLSQRIIQEIKKSGGTLKLSDKSPADEIAEHFQCSKKAYKKALGALYKQGLIEISKEQVKLV